MILLTLLSCDSSINTTPIAKNLVYDYYILIDFSMASNSNRLKIYDIRNDKVVYSCKCAHGIGGGAKATAKSFSNVVGSRKTSLGRYKIGRKRILQSFEGWDISMFKIPCYELYGLDKTNSNAYKRGILLHADPTISTAPIPILPIHSFGCLSVPSSSFRKISRYIDKNKVLIVAYYKNLGDYIQSLTQQGRAVVARKFHKLEVVGSSPTPATIKDFEQLYLGINI